MRRTIDSPRHLRLVEILTERRKSARLTQEDIAKLLEVPQSVISSLERGGRRIDIVEFLEIAELIGLDPHFLIGELLALPVR
jgi:HTH-type transcriptional regulator/antitoxin HipB